MALMGKLSNKWAGGVLLVVCGCFLIDKGVHWGFERMLACMESEMLEEPDSVLVYLKGNWRWSQDFVCGCLIPDKPDCGRFCIKCGL